LRPLAESRRHTRLDMDYLCALTEAIGKDPEFRPVCIYFPNSTLYSFGDRLRYVEKRITGNDRSHHLVAVETTPHVSSALAAAQSGAGWTGIVQVLSQQGLDPAEAEELIGQLIDSQILESDLSPCITGEEPLSGLISKLGGHSPTNAIAQVLTAVSARLADLDDRGLGASPAEYHAVAGDLSSLPAKPEMAKLVQVDMVKPADVLELGERVLAELKRAISVLHRIGRPNFQETLYRFQEAFLARFEGRFVPLAEALDEESGVGFETPGDSTRDHLVGRPSPSFLVMKSLSP